MRVQDTGLQQILVEIWAPEIQADYVSTFHFSVRIRVEALVKECYLLPWGRVDSDIIRVWKVAGKAT